MSIRLKSLILDDALLDYFRLGLEKRFRVAFPGEKSKVKYEEYVLQHYIQLLEFVKREEEKVSTLE